MKGKEGEADPSTVSYGPFEKKLEIIVAKKKGREPKDGSLDIQTYATPCQESDGKKISLVFSPYGSHIGDGRGDRRAGMADLPWHTRGIRGTPC